MKVALIGPTGFVGKEVLKELLDRTEGPVAQRVQSDTTIRYEFSDGTRLAYPQGSTSSQAGVW